MKKVLPVLLILFSILNSFAQNQDNKKNITGTYSQKNAENCHDQNSITIKEGGTFEKIYIGSMSHYTELDTTNGTWTYHKGIITLEYIDHYKKPATEEYKIFKAEILTRVKKNDCPYYKK